jgi:hypothetical protein
MFSQTLECARRRGTGQDYNRNCTFEIRLYRGSGCIGDSTLSRWCFRFEFVQTGFHLGDLTGIS